VNGNETQITIAAARAEIQIEKASALPKNGDRKRA
jgi:hypothetical protein